MTHKIPQEPKNLHTLVFPKKGPGLFISIPDFQQLRVRICGDTAVSVSFAMLGGVNRLVKVCPNTCIISSNNLWTA